MLYLISGEAYNRTFDFRGRVEDSFVDGEQILNVVKSLEKHTQNAVIPAAGRLGQTYGDFALDHADHFGDQIAIFEDFEENLRRDIVD